MFFKRPKSRQQRRAAQRMPSSERRWRRNHVGLTGKQARKVRKERTKYRARPHLF